MRVRHLRGGGGFLRHAALIGLDDIQEVEINWVWSPPWGPDRLTEDGKMALRAMGFAI